MMAHARYSPAKTGLHSWFILRLLVVAVLVAAVAAPLGLLPATNAAAATGDVTISGRGYGHGRGMGQYGAYGYAVTSGWNHAQILQHFYGGTVLAGNAGNPVVGVELTGLTGVDTVVTAPGLMVNGASVSGSPAVLVRRAADGSFLVYTGPGCGGPWKAWATRASGLKISSSADASKLQNLLRVCEPTTTHGYRGTLTVVNSAGRQYVVNDLPSESYLRGVVPRESPASWGSAGGGRGMQALKAQAVAARSYSLRSARRPSGAITCDTTACQVYGGAYAWPYDGSLTSLDAANSDAAVAQTAGQVMRTGTVNGAIARTEFSSSTGGYTTGGTFPPVVDDGDGTTNNPNHTWTAVLPLADVAARLGTGPIRSITVTGRNGLGADGGRVTQLTVRTEAGPTSTYTGAAVRSALGLKSDWFTVSAVSVPAAQAGVRSLYWDILKRDVDSTGLKFWSAEVMRSGGAGTTAAALSTSQERLRAMVTVEYLGALHRAPDLGGLMAWVGLLQTGRGLPDLQIGIYGSGESLLVLGGGSSSVWVAAMYKAILGRAAVPSEAQWWAENARRYGRASAVSGIARSQEAAGRRLSLYYTTMLGRAVDPTGRATFLPLLMTGRGDLTVPVTIGQSVEYWNRAQTRY